LEPGQRRSHKKQMTGDVYRVRTPAKLNIRLKVIGKRPDGYHEVVTLMVPVSISDTLEFRLTGREGELTLTCEGYGVPEDETNLVLLAARQFLSETGLRAGISITLKKKIPVAAGMGGGSSDAAATLTALNELFSRPLAAEGLYRLARGLGADVPFFLYNRPCLARGIGEILEPLESWPAFWYVIVKPPIQVATSWAYGSLKLRLTGDEYGYIKKFLGGKQFSLKQVLENDLEEVTAARYPIIEKIKGHLSLEGAEGALMTGSGPGVFGIFRRREKAARACDKLREKRWGEVFLTTDWQP